MSAGSPARARACCWPPRADAARNRETLLAHATELIAERGPGVALDEIARAAGLGNATLYRHFPDRTALLEAIALRVISATAAAAERALADEPDPFEALGRYLREALAVRVAWVMPVIAGDLDLRNPELAAARDRSVRAVRRLLAAAAESGAIRPGITFGDVSLMLLRLARPLPARRGRAAQDVVAARHLAIFLDGLRPCGRELPGTGPDLREMAGGPDPG